MYYFPKNSITDIVYRLNFRRSAEMYGINMQLYSSSDSKK